MIRKTILMIAAAALTLAVPSCAAGGLPAASAAGSEAVYSQPAQGEIFSDVPYGAWYAEAVGYLAENGIMNGTGGGYFTPDGTFTRAQLAAVLYRIEGEPAVSGEDGFTDTEPGAWYADAVLWAEKSGVVNGVGGGLFAPDDAVTQEQLATMLWRMENEPGAAPAGDASEYAAAAVGWARGAAIAPATADYTFAPKQNALRSQTAALLHGYLTRGRGAKAPSPAPAEAGITLNVEGRTLQVEWVDNSSVDALRELLAQGDITLDMSDYSGFEKGAPLPGTLPENNVQMNADAGDIILYQGRQFVIYYDTNSWSLTPLGRITGLTKDELQSLLGAGNVTAVLSIARGAE